MKLDSVVAIQNPDYTVSINWDYIKEFIDNENHFVVNVSVANSEVGPFTYLITKVYSDTKATYKLPSKGYYFVYFKLDLFDVTTQTISDSEIVGVQEVTDLIVNKIRNKKRILHQNKLNNELHIYKQKRIGYHCRRCWSDTESHPTKDDCPVCYGTGYGNDSVYQAHNLRLDGLLKLNAEGYLEFSLLNHTFHDYTIDTDTYAIDPGDFFTIESMDNKVLAIYAIKDVLKSSLVLDHKSEEILTTTTHCKFSVYRQKFIHTVPIDLAVLIQDGRGKLSYMPPTANKVQYGYTVFEIQNGWLLGDLDALYTHETKLMFLHDDLVLESRNSGNLLVIDTTYNFVMADPPQACKYIYIDYRYDGKALYKYNNKQHVLSTSTTPTDLTMVFKVLEVGSYITCDLITLSEYPHYTGNSNETEFIFDHVFTQSLTSALYTTEYCYVLNQLSVYLDGSPIVKIPHTDILVEGFRGCGVLLINLTTGITYAGQDSTTPGDFEFNTETAELNVSKLPKGNYEIKYIYRFKDIQIKNKFVPVNPVFEGGILKSVDSWAFYHDNVSTGVDTSGVFLAIGWGNEYDELQIQDHKNNKLVLTPKDRPDLLWRSINPDTRFSLDYTNTGGYYRRQTTYGNVLHMSLGLEYATPTGIVRHEDLSVEIPIDVMVSTNDLIYIPKINEAFLISKIMTRVLKLYVLSSVCELTDLPYNSRKLYAKLLV